LKSFKFSLRYLQFLSPIRCVPRPKDVDSVAKDSVSFGYCRNGIPARRNGENNRRMLAAPRGWCCGYRTGIPILWVGVDVSFEPCHLGYAGTKRAKFSGMLVNLSLCSSLRNCARLVRAVGSKVGVINLSRHPSHLEQSLGVAAQNFQLIPCRQRQSFHPFKTGRVSYKRVVDGVQYAVYAHLLNAAKQRRV